jgi:hypothetical protein
VTKHNDLRRKVAKGLELRGASGSGPQPKAANMFQLVWDPVLARMAQRSGSSDSYVDKALLQCKPLNMITLGQRETDYFTRMMTIS